jgi:ATP-dependent RNA helicase RhlE
MTFDDFDFNPDLSDSLYHMGFEKATPIQEQAIPKILEGRDVIATAQTGTGKTAAFMLPILNKLADNPCPHINTLIVVPTRELALQIDQQIQGFAYFLRASSIALYGGGDGMEFVEQKRAMENGVNIIVATPGKLISHLNMGYVNLSHLKHFVLDEADRMLDMGFSEDVKKIITFLPKERQNLMFSATMPNAIHKLIKQLMHNPFEIKIAISKPAKGVKQGQYEVFPAQKIPLIQWLVKDRINYRSILIFTSTKEKVNEVVRGLRRKNIPAVGISSDLNQKEREQVLLDFRSKKTKVLVTTNVLSRGIDIKDINLIINFDVPGDAEDYVHRIGRTARAETKGEAITLVDKEDAYKMLRIERLIEQSIEKLSLDSSLGKAPNFKQNSPKGNKNRSQAGSNRSKGKPGKKHTNRGSQKPKS